MVRFLLLLLFVFSFIKADLLDDKIQNLVGDTTYISQKRFINIIFKSRDSFYNYGNLDILKVVKKLKANNLLNLQYTSPQEVTINFFTTQNYPIIFIKVIQNALNSMGYGYILTNKATRDENGFSFKVTLKTETAIDPVLFAQELKKRGCNIEDIQRYSDTSWQYDIDISQIKLLVKDIKPNQKIKLKKPLEPYWLSVENRDKLILKSYRNNSWYPYIVFYDQYLNIIDVFSQDKISYNASLKIPNDAKYAKISDIYTLDNIKRGLIVTILH